MSATWMIVERHENWLADMKEGFLTFGLSERHGRQARMMEAGDLVVVYVSSNISAFSDVREVCHAAVTPFTGSFAKYGAPFFYKIQTRSVLELPEDRWVSIRGLLQELSFTKGRDNWSPVMQTSLRKLNAGDARLIVEAMILACDGNHEVLLSSIPDEQE